MKLNRYQRLVPRRKSHPAAGFSLVEVLVMLVVMGTIVFLAVPNIVQVRQDSEDNLARSRAEALNVASAAYFQATGTQAAAAAWSAAGSDEARYSLVAPYLAYAPGSLSAFMPSGYSVSFSSDPLRTKASLSRGGSALPY